MAKTIKEYKIEYKVVNAGINYNNIGIVLKYEKFYRHNEYKHGYILAFTLFNRTKSTTRDGVTFTTDEFAPYDENNFRTIIEPIPAEKRFSPVRFKELIKEYNSVEKLNDKIKKCGFKYSIIDEPAIVTIDERTY